MLHGRAGSVDNTQSVWQNKSIVWHEFSSLHGFSLQNTIILIVVTEKIQIFAGILIFFATDCTGCSWPFAVLYKLRYYE